jgi:hypothetical protein
VPWQQLEDLLLKRVDPDLEVDLALPPLTYRGSAEVRDLILRALPLDLDREVMIRQNEDGQIVSLRLPIRPEWLSASPPRLPDGWVGTALNGTSTRNAEKAGDDADRGIWGWVKGIGIAVGVLTAILTFLGLFFERFPSLGPDVPPPELAVVVDDVVLEERVTTDSNRFLLVVSYRISFTGYKDDVIHVEWAAFDAQSLARVRFAASVTTSSRGNGGADDVKADAETDRGRGRIEFPRPPTGDCIFVRVYAYDTDYNRLDYADTPPFHRSDPVQPCDATPPTAAATEGGAGQGEGSEP